MDATGAVNGLGIGNPNVEFSPDVTCVSIDSNTSRMIWGFRTGFISSTSLNRQGTSPRGNIKSFKFAVPGINRGSHLGEIRCISTPFGTNQGNGKNGGGCGGSKSSMRNRERLRKATLSLGEKALTFASAGQDGSVRIWKEGRVEPFWIGWAKADSSADGSRATSSSNCKPLSALEYDASEGTILTGNDDGELFLWSGIDILGLMEIPAEVLTQPSFSSSSSEISDGMKESRASLELLQDRIDFVHIPNFTGEANPIKHLVLDEPPKSRDLSILCHAKGNKVFTRHTIKFQDSKSEEASSPIISTTVFGSASTSEITTLRVDFDFAEASSPSKGAGITSITSSPARSPQLGPKTTNFSRKAKAGAFNQTSTSDSLPPTKLVLGPSTSALLDSQKGKGIYFERKFVVGGTKDGRTFIWDWEAEGEVFEEETQRKWQSPSAVPLSAPSYSGAALGQTSSSRSLPAELVRGDRQVSPSVILPRHTTSITSLEITPSFIITGSSDGIIKIYDSLTTQLVRTINDRAAKNAASRLLAAGDLSEEDASRFLVRQILATEETLVATIGHQTLAWRAENIISSRSNRKNGISSSSNSNGSRTPSKLNSRRADTKYEGNVQLKRDVWESEEMIQKEREMRNDTYRRLKFETKYGDQEMNGLNEQEALEYALMISRDEEEAKRLDEALNASSDFKGKGKQTDEMEDQDLAEALERSSRIKGREEDSREEGDLSLDGLEVDDRDWPSPSMSPSPSPLSSPLLTGISTPSRAMEIFNASGPNASYSSERNRPDYGRAYGSEGRDRNEKVRTVSVSREARLSVSHSNSSSSYTSPRFEPSSSSSRNGNNGSNDQVPPFSLNSPEHWPAVSPPNSNPLDSSSRSLSSVRSSSGTKHQGSSPSFSALSSSHNSPAPSPSPNSWSRKPSLGGAWSNGSPSLRATSVGSGVGDGGSRVQGNTSSLLGRSLGQAAASQTKREEPEMDEEMRFAIELSLAEERSRLDRDAKKD